MPPMELCVNDVKLEIDFVIVRITHIFSVCNTRRHKIRSEQGDIAVSRCLVPSQI